MKLHSPQLFIKYLVQGTTQPILLRHRGQEAESIWVDDFSTSNTVTDLVAD